jgi:hypothetical protein
LIGTAVGLAVHLGVYAFVDGVGLIIAAFRGHSCSSQRANALSGLAGLVMAVLAVTWPGMTVLTLTVLAGVWALLTGVGRSGSACAGVTDVAGHRCAVVASVSGLRSIGRCPGVPQRPWLCGAIVMQFVMQFGLEAAETRRCHVPGLAVSRGGSSSPFSATSSVAFRPS